MENVFSGSGLSRAAEATIALESIPPLRNAPNGDVAHHMQADRFLEKPAHAIDEIVFVSSVVRLELEVPVAFDHRSPARRRGQKCPGSSLCTPSMIASVGGVERNENSATPRSS